MSDKIDRVAIFAARRASLQKPVTTATVDDKGSKPSDGTDAKGKAFFSNLAPGVFARRKVGA